jgi:hypothetical protein
MENILDLLARDPNIDPKFRQAVAIAAYNAAVIDLAAARKPEAIQRPLPGADFRALTRRDEEMLGYGYSDDLADYSTGGK